MENNLDTSTLTSILTSSPLNDAEQNSYSDYFDPRFPKWLAIIIFIVGLIGNIICLIIFNKLKKNSTFIYLAFLSIIDIFVLLFGLGDIILISYFNYVIRNSSLVICRVHSFLTYASTHLSSLILASISIDRAIATNMITFSKIYCKPNVAYKVIFVNIILSSLVNFHNLAFLGFHVPATTPTTTPTTTNVTKITDVSNNNVTSSRTHLVEVVCASELGTLYDTFLDPYFKWIDLFFYAIIPFTIMGACTFFIVRVLFLSNRRLNQKKNVHHNRTDSTNTAPDTNGNNKNENKAKGGATDAPPAKAPLIKNGGTTKKSISTNARANKAKHLTYTLIALNCVFFFLVSPLVITLIFFDSPSLYKILINIVYLMSYSNHAINFILYYFSSPPYRDACNKMFNIKNLCKKSSPNTQINRAE
jgi:hypothetical protein